jgi:signal transduction histidine kinase/DNA-binding response OmpR family regulator
LKTILSILLLFIGINLNGQAPFSVDFKLYLQSDGLSSNVTYTAIEDDKGIFWIGTQKGITRFDGQYLKAFNAENGIALGEVQQLFFDENILWCFQKIGQKYRLFLFHTLEERLLSIPEHLGQNLPFNQSNITDIQFLSKGLIFHIQSDNKKTTYSYIPKKGFTELPFINKKNQIISITNDGFYWLINTEKKVKLNKVNALGSVLKKTTGNFFTTKIPNEIIEIGEEYIDKNDKVFIKFITVAQFGFFSINTKGELKFEAKRLRSSFDPAVAPSFYNLKYYPKNNLLTYRLNNDISFYALSGTKLQQIHIPLKNGLGRCLPNNHFSLFSTQNGICVAEFTYNSVLPKFNTFLKKEKVATRGIMAVEEQLYVNAIELYITDIDFKKGYKKEFQEVEGFGIIKDKSDNLWIERRGKFVYFDTKTKKKTAYPIEDNPWAMYEDEQGLIWYNSGQKFIALNPKTGKKTTLNNSGLEKFKDLNIYHFHKKADGLLLLLTNFGIFEFSLQKGLINHYSSKQKGKYYLPAKDFRHLYFDKKTSTYWLASNEGLIRWQLETADYEVFTFNNFSANTIQAVYPDAFGHLWLSTENGIIQFDKSTYKFKTYLEKDGISHHEFNRISHFQDADATIYFGSLEGVTKFHPKDFKAGLKNIKNPKINVLEVNQYLGKTNNLENLTADFYHQQRIIVQPNDGYFTLKMNVSDYPIFSKVQLLYKLENSETWEVAADNEITIRKLPYDNYILQIKAVGESGQFTTEYLEIPIVIKKPLYLKWWFWVLIGTLFIGLILGVTKWRTQEINRRNKELEQEVGKRTKQIESDKRTIEEQADRLLELDKTKSKFFANVSHELRTPITLIKGPIQSVLNSNELGNRNLSLLANAERNTENLLRLVNEILDLTKMEANKLILDESKVVFYLFVRRIIANFQSFADIKNIEFSFIYNLNKSLQLKLDEAKFEKVLNNLLSNAFKFTPQNGRVEVVVSEGSDALKSSAPFTSDSYNSILIKVKDNGRGISPEDIPYVFNRFYQSKTNTKAEGGLGIGLALSMEFVQLMKGKMWVESSSESKSESESSLLRELGENENQGSTFFVEIPKKEIIAMLSTENELEIQQELATNPTGFKNLSDLKSTHQHTILLVEDNADLREYVSFLLSPFYNIITANNGREGLKKLAVNSLQLANDSGELPTVSVATANCQLILSDVMMPIMDGFEFLEIVKSKAEYRNIPFIMLTARVELKDRLKALRIGVDDYLIKPFNEAELLTRIKNLLKNYENRLDFHSENQPIEAAEIVENDFLISEADRLWLQKLETIILKEVNNSIFNIDYLVELLEINRNAFYSKVKALTGLSPNKYIQAIRLQMAKDLLENTDFSIKEITQKVGFKTPDYFTRLFKKEYGKLPSEYLK